MKLSVCIVTWNSSKYMESCLKALREQTFKDFELLIVDNNSSDDTVLLAKKYYPESKVIINEENLGFCGGHNIGIQRSVGEYYMPYNPDIIAEPDFLAYMVRAMELDPKVGSVSGKLRRFDPIQNKKTNVIDSTGVYFKKNRRSLDRGSEEIDAGQFDSIQYVFGSSGAAPLYRRTMLEDIKLNEQYFNEGFFAYREDVDLAWRAQLKGWKCLYDYRALAYHVRNNTPEKRSQMTTFVNMHSVKNRILMIYQNESLLGLLKDGFVFVLYDLLILAYVLFKERTSIPAIKYLISHRREINLTRKEIQKSATVAPKLMLKWFGRVQYERYPYNDQVQNVFVIGSKGIPARYGGFETFVDQLTQRRQNQRISYHVSCLNSEEQPDFQHNGARCFNVTAPEIGGAKAILYDLKSLKASVDYINAHQLRNSIIYVLACRIGPFYRWYLPKLKRNNIRLVVNPDGHEWKRSKWSWAVRKYWKISERLMVKSSECLVCDSEGIEDYIQKEYSSYKPNTVFISYGADITNSALTDHDPSFIEWLTAHSVKQDQYYLIVGRFVPENNYELIIKEFMKSNSNKDLVIISNVEQNVYYNALLQNTRFDQDKRIKFVGTVYNQELLKKIREKAYGYFHGHEVGGTNPSLLEALASTKLNLLLKVNFNQEVGREAAVYFSKDNDDLMHLIHETELLSEQERGILGEKAKLEVVRRYSWTSIVQQYESFFLNGTRDVLEPSKDHRIEEKQPVAVNG